MTKLFSIYAMLLLSCIIMALAGCGDDGEIIDKGPSIVKVYPNNGADDMPSTAAIMVTFDEHISTPSAANLIFTPGVSGTVSYEASCCTLTYKPIADLAIGVEYEVRIEGITDVEGNAMQAVTTKFTTTAPDKERPEVTVTFPGTDSEDIGHDEELTFVFSEPIDRAKFRSAIYFTPEIDLEQSDWQIEWGFGNEEQVTISPPPSVYAYPLNKNCTLLLAKANATDTSGNPLLVDYKLEFKTLRYAIFDPKTPIFDVRAQEPLWLYRLGNWNSKWVAIWGGSISRGGPSGSSPAGTITASADGYIVASSIEKIMSHVPSSPLFDHTLTKGNGNSLTYLTKTADNDDWFTLIFASTSKYVTFDLRSSSGTTPPEFVHIGKNFENPEKTPFVLRNKDIR